MKFEFAELNTKPATELRHILEQLHEQLRDLRFKAAAKQLKNVAEIKQTKKTIARILFILTQPPKIQVTAKAASSSTETK